MSAGQPHFFLQFYANNLITSIIFDNDSLSDNKLALYFVRWREIENQSPSR